MADVVVAEGGPATFTVSRTGDTSGTSSAKARTSGGSAAAGVDYTAQGLTTLSFAPGETTKTLTVEVIPDTAPEANETFNLVLSAGSGATLSDTSATATIADYDGAAYLGVDDVWVGEGDSGTTPATFTVTRSGNTTAGSTVKVQTKPATASAGVDYAAVGLSTVAFAPGQNTATVTVEVVADTADEADERFTLALSSPSGATVSDPSGTATIVDDDRFPCRPGTHTPRVLWRTRAGCVAGIRGGSLDPDPQRVPDAVHRTPRSRAVTPASRLSTTSWRRSAGGRVARDRPVIKPRTGARPPRPRGHCQKGEVRVPG